MTAGLTKKAQELALETIKSKIWSPSTCTKPIFILTVARSTTSWSRKVRYLLPTGKSGREALEDITALVCRAGFGQWNERVGCANIKGGDGSDALHSLSLELFGDYQTLPVFSI